jgi:hypothetical protein
MWQTAHLALRDQWLRASLAQQQQQAGADANDAGRQLSSRRSPLAVLELCALPVRLGCSALLLDEADAAAIGAAAQAVAAT